jgi:putative membrane protein
MTRFASSYLSGTCRIAAVLATALTVSLLASSAASAAGHSTDWLLLAQNSNTGGATGDAGGVSSGSGNDGGTNAGTGATMAPAENSSGGAMKSLSADSKDYVDKAAMTDHFEIMSSKLALKQSKNADIKKFAQQMVSDHGKSTAQLKSVIRKDKLDVKPPMKLDDEHAKLYKQLESAKGADFDKLYAKIQTEGHEEALKLHQTYAENGDQPDLKTFAGEVSKVVEMHLDHITAINKALH